jgi:hypothetical protein
MASLAQRKQWALRLLQVTAEMNLSFRALTDSTIFRQWMLEALGWEVPSKDVSRRLLPLYYGELVKSLKAQLEAVDSVSITTDSTYLTRHQLPYIAITAHFIDASWQLHDSVLSVFVAQQSESGAYIAKQLKHILHKRLKLSGKLHCIVTDEGANFLSAASLLKDSEIIDESIRCACHRFQLTIKKAICHKDCRALKVILDKCQAMVLEFQNGWASKKKDVWRRCQQQQIDSLQQDIDRLRSSNLTRARAEQLLSAEIVIECDQLRQALQAEIAADCQAAAESQHVDDTVNMLFAGDVQGGSDEPSSDLDSDSDDDDDVNVRSDYRAMDPAGSEEVGKEEKKEVLSVAAAEESAVDKLQRLVVALHTHRALIQRCATRWMTYVAMAERVLMWKDAFRMAADELFNADYQFSRGRRRRNQPEFDADSIRLTDEEMTVLQQFVSVCEPARQVLKACEGSTSPTISHLLFCYYALRNHLTSASKNLGYHQVVKTFATCALDEVQLKFDARGKDVPAVIAACLDPRYRQLHYLTEDDKRLFHNLLYEKYRALKVKLQPPAEAAVSEPLAKKPRLDLNKIGNFAPSVAKAADEFDTWTRAPNVSEDADVLAWWKNNESSFPVLAQLARRYLAVPASSAPSERLFSRLKDTLTTKRVRMSGETLSQLLFVRHHQRELLEATGRLDPAAQPAGR